MLKLRQVVSSLVLTTAIALPWGDGLAQDHPPGGGGPRGGEVARGPGFYGRSFHSFGPGELRAWQGGRWVHDWHDGRFAWWWTVNGWWYFYPEPVYPYPVYVPPAVVVEQAPPSPTGLPPAQSWYFCDNPQGYYPYVASCAGPWRAVPATPPAK